MPLEHLGPAALGWPAVGAAVDAAAHQLHVVSRNTAPPLWASIDLRTWALAGRRRVPRGDGAWAVTPTAAGLLLGLFGTSGPNVLRGTASGLTDLAEVDTRHVWELQALPDGGAVGVGSAPSRVFVLSADGRVSLRAALAARFVLPRTVVVLPDQVVIGGRSGTAARLLATDVAGTSEVSVLPAALADHRAVYCSDRLDDRTVVVGTVGPQLRHPAVAVVPLRGGQPAITSLPGETAVDQVLADGPVVWATARPSGALYRIAGGGVRSFALPVRGAETRLLARVGRDLLGVAGDGSVWTVDRETARTTVRTPAQLGFELLPERPQSLAAARRYVDVPGSFGVTRRVLSTGGRRQAFLPGEAKAALHVDETTYFALYPTAEVWAWSSGARAPRLFARLPRDQFRPRDLVHVPALDALAATTRDDAGPAALHVVQLQGVPGGRTVRTYPEPVGPGADAVGIGVDGDTALVGSSGSSPAVAAIDLRTGFRRWRRDDVAPGGFVLGAQPIGGGVLVTTSTGHLALLDRDGGALRRVELGEAAGWPRRLSTTRWLLPTETRLVELAVALSDGRPRRLSVRTVEHVVPAEVFNWRPLSIGPSGDAYLVAGRDLVRWRRVSP